MKQLKHAWAHHHQGVRTERMAAAKCAKITEFSKVLQIFAKICPPLGGGRGLVTGVIVKLLVAAKVDLEMVPSAELAIRSDRARCRGESCSRLRGRADEVGEQA